MATAINTTKMVLMAYAFTTTMGRAVASSCTSGQIKPLRVGWA
jgi:hypothetical protein